MTVAELIEFLEALENRDAPVTLRVDDDYALEISAADIRVADSHYRPATNEPCCTVRGEHVCIG